MVSASRSRPALLCCLLAILAWSGSIVRGGLSYDDHEILFDSPVVEGTLPWTAVLDRDWWHHRGDAGHWRPTALASLRVDRGLWGTHPAGYHATNVLLHALVVLLAGLLLARLARGSALPWLGLAVFAAHPALADSVAWISGRTSMFAALGGLVGGLALARELARPEPRALPVAATAGAGLLLALAGKEDGLVFAPLYVLACAAADGRRVRTRAVLACAVGCTLALAAWMCARTLALGAPLPGAPHAPLADTALATRLVVGGRVIVEALRLFALPLDHSPGLRLEDLPLAALPRAAAVVAAGGWALCLVTLAGSAALLATRARRAPLVAGSALLAATALLPYLQLVPSGEIFAPRFLYLPALLGVPLVHALLARVTPLSRGWTAAAIALVAVPLAWERAGTYASRSSYWRARIAFAPSDPAAWNDLGLGLEEEGRTAAARAAWRRATELDPGYSRAHSNLGRALLADGDVAAAAEALDRAARVGPRNAVAHCNLGGVLLRLERPAEAARAYERAIRIAPGMAAAWRGLGNARLQDGDRAGALVALRSAIGLDPGDALTARLIERAERSAEAESPR